jgi:sterol O-acyltransferase
MLLLGIFKVMMPSMAASLLMFYMVLHSWLNAFAELTRFADRYVTPKSFSTQNITNHLLVQFYSDWWNVTNWAAYYRVSTFLSLFWFHEEFFLKYCFFFFSFFSSIRNGTMSFTISCTFTCSRT